jgi:hypothetical protein
MGISHLALNCLNLTVLPCLYIVFFFVDFPLFITLLNYLFHRDVTQLNLVVGYYPILGQAFNVLELNFALLWFQAIF